MTWSPSLRRSWMLVALALPSVLSACAGATPNGETAFGGRGAIADVHAHKCGRCHAPPEPKTRSRQHLADAFGRHQRRVHLSQEQWAAMVDYLAAPTSTAAHDM